MYIRPNPVADWVRNVSIKNICEIRCRIENRLILFFVMVRLPGFFPSYKKFPDPPQYGVWYE